MKQVELWEIMKDGKDGEIYEVVSCSVRGYIGDKIKVKSSHNHKESFKCLVNPDIKGGSEDALAKLYGCLGTAKFQKVDDYEEIKLSEAVEMLNDFRTVFVKSGNEYKEITRYTDFLDSDLYITDFADLVATKFYKNDGKKQVNIF